MPIRNLSVHHMAHMTQITAEALIAQYILHTNDMQAQDAECDAAGLNHDIARWVVARNGADEAAKALRDIFGVDIEGDAGRTQ